MIHRTYGALLTGVLILLASTVIASPAVAASPWFMMFYGSPLSKPIVLKNSKGDFENFIVLENTKVMYIEPESLDGRSYVKMALFWGPEWQRYRDEGKPVDALRPEQANQHARFYPTVDGADALIVIDPISVSGSSVRVRRVEPEGLAVLARHGVPVRSESTAPSSNRLPGARGRTIGAESGAIGAVAAVIVLATVGAYAVLRLRSGSS